MRGARERIGVRASACLPCLVGFVTAMHVLLACGTDGSSPPDAGTPSSSSSAPTPPPATLTVRARAQGAYIGQRIELSATAEVQPSAPATFAWRFVEVPKESAVSETDPSTGATAAFVPDVAGRFVLRVTAAAGEAATSTDLSIDVRDAPVFFLTELSLTSFSVDFVPATRGEPLLPPRSVSCLPAYTPAIDVSAVTAGFARLGADWWEAPDGNAARVAFVAPKAGAEGSLLLGLYVTNDAAHCPDPPLETDVLPPIAAGLPPISRPHFSPGGDRIAYARATNENDAGPRVVVATVGHDGRNPHREVAALNYGDLRPHWLDSTHVAWLARPGGAGWQILVAADADRAPVAEHMNCPDAYPQAFELLPEGRLLVLNSSDLVIYRRVPESGRCHIERRLAAPFLITPQGQSLSVSPDRKSAAFIGLEAGEAAVFVVDLGDPSSSPRRVTRAPDVVVSTPLDGGGASTKMTGGGTRWIAGGSRITWASGTSDGDAGHTLYAATPDGRDVRAITAANDGGSPRIFFVDRSGAAAKGAGCTSAPARGGDGGGGIVTAHALAILLAARRRRPRRQGVT